MPLLKSRKFGSSMKTSHLIADSRGMFIIGRHTTRGGSAPTGITPEGEMRAEWSSRNLPKGVLLHVAHPNKPRHAATAQIIYKSYPGERGMLMEFDSLNFDRYLTNAKEFDRLCELIKDPAVTQMWLRGEIGPEVVNEAKGVGRTILADVQKKFHESEVKGKKNLLVSITSAGAEGAILKSLGIDPMTVKPKKAMSKERPAAGDLLRFTEGMLFFVGPKNELIMKFRGRAFKIVRKSSGLVAVRA